MSIEILHRDTGAVLYTSDLNNVRDALVRAVEAHSNLWGANLRRANLQGANLPAGYHIAMLCFGGWGVTVGPTETCIGCEKHPNTAWLGWAVDAPEIAAMHPKAAVWWRAHRESVCAVIRDVQGEE